MVLCNEPVMRTPFNGFCGPYFCRIAIRPGISCSETWMVLRPHSARDRSRTLKSSLAAVPPLDPKAVAEGLPSRLVSFARAGGSLMVAMVLFDSDLKTWADYRRP